MRNASEFKNGSNNGGFKKAKVKAIEQGQFLGYEVTDAGNLDGAPILDKNRFYTMDQIYKITERLNERAGRMDPGGWVQYIDQE